MTVTFMPDTGHAFGCDCEIKRLSIIPSCHVRQKFSNSSKERERFPPHIEYCVTSTRFHLQ
jgi:hypothetical protein